MIDLVRIRVQGRQAVPANQWAIASRFPAEDHDLSTVRLTAWTRDEVVGAELFRAPVSVATTSATMVSTDDTKDADEHLFADADETDPSWLWAADVIVRRGDVAGEGTEERQLLSIFRSFPGCLIAGILGPGNGCAVGSRDGWSTNVVGRSARGTEARILGWYASFAHAWITSGRSLAVLADAYVTVSVEASRRGEHESYSRVISVIGSDS
jgi:hypothetical protein